MGYWAWASWLQERLWLGSSWAFWGRLEWVFVGDPVGVKSLIRCVWAQASSWTPSMWWNHWCPCLWLESEACASGWNLRLVTGLAQETSGTEAADDRDQRGQGLPSWAPGHPDHFPGLWCCPSTFPSFLPNSYSHQPFLVKSYSSFKTFSNTLLTVWAR